MSRIPKILHYCWVGKNPLPELEQKCLASWHEHMPDWEYKWWNESNFNIASAPLYVRQAYEARKYAFVSDYVRLWALEKFGGLYMDVDFMVYRPFDELMDTYAAFAGYEGSKRQPVMQGVIASEAHGAWVTDMLRTYDTRAFIKEDGSLDMYPNTQYFTDRLISHGFIPDGIEKDFYIERKTKTENNTLREINIDKQELTKNNESKVTCSNSNSLDPQSAQKQAFGQPDAQSCSDTDISYPLDSSEKNPSLHDSQKMPKNIESRESKVDSREFFLHVFPVQYFCPVLTTGEDLRTNETYCEHKGESSWAKQGWKGRVLAALGPKWRTRMIKLKRKLLG